MLDAGTDRDDEIRQIAYRLWQEEGCPDGREAEHWLKAEAIWLEEHRPENGPKKKAVRSTRTKRNRASQTHITAAQ